jgi:type I restriction enzyme S subunit
LGSNSFTYYTACSLQPELQQYEQTGTVFGAITRKQFETLPVISPAEQLVSAFESLVLPLEHRLRGNVVDARSLAAQRDALLPRLVSGKVRVQYV